MDPISTDVSADTDGNVMNTTGSSDIEEDIVRSHPVIKAVLVVPDFNCINDDKSSSVKAVKMNSQPTKTHTIIQPLEYSNCFE
jgi:hypothetical protein